MTRLEIYVVQGCPSCVEARRIGQRIAQLPDVDVHVIELESGETPPASVVAVPTYVLDGRVISLGNPDPRVLVARLAHLVFSARGPLVLASGTLLGSALLCLALLLIGGVCLVAGPVEVNLAVAQGILDLAGALALTSGTILGGTAVWTWHHSPILEERGLAVARTVIGWDDVAAVREHGGHDPALDVCDRNGRRLHIPTHGLDARSVRTLRAWLRALDLDGEPVTVHGCGSDRCPTDVT
jgi:hypothetical protein